MTQIDITVKLPEELVERAQSAGILTDERIAGLISAELERRTRVDALFDTIDKLHALEPPLNEAGYERIRTRKRRSAGRMRRDTCRSRYQFTGVCFLLAGTTSATA